MMAIEDQGGNDDAEDKICLGIAPKEGNENRDGDCTGYGPERDKPPSPNEAREEKKFDQDRKR